MCKTKSFKQKLTGKTCLISLNQGDTFNTFDLYLIIITQLNFESNTLWLIKILF